MAPTIKTITFSEVLDIMDSGREFSAGVRTYSTTTGEGGEWLSLPRCVKSGMRQNDKIAVAMASGERFRKNPNHWPNSTRNLVELPEANIVKVHLRLIRKFNGKTVI